MTAPVRPAKRSRTYLDIPFEQKEMAKRLGARWDKEGKKWYVLGEVPELLMDCVREPPLLELPGRSAPPPAEQGPTLRQPPSGDAQPDFFIPSLFDIATKDNRSIMDVAVFRLSKRDKRASEIIRYELPDGHVEVKSGPDGMASVWDYDIVLMAISHLTEALNRYKSGRGEMPGRTFQPHVSEILKFCRKSDGGRQYEEIEAALDRLKNTTLKIVRTKKGRGGRALRLAEAEGLISNYKTTSYADNGRLQMVEIEIPSWIYREVVETENPDVLTMHPDFFLLNGGLERFVYRLARRAAGKGAARWMFRTIYERSGSTGTFKKFTFSLREMIQTNGLPEYSLSEEAGQDGAVLVITHRSVLTSEPATSS